MIASDRELRNEILKHLKPEESICGLCGGEIVFNQFIQKPICKGCETVHDIEDVWMFQSGKKPVVVKAYAPTETSKEDHAILNTAYWRGNHLDSSLDEQEEDLMFKKCLFKRRKITIE